MGSPPSTSLSSPQLAPEDDYRASVLDKPPRAPRSTFIVAALLPRVKAEFVPLRRRNRERSRDKKTCERSHVMRRPAAKKTPTYDPFVLLLIRAAEKHHATRSEWSFWPKGRGENGTTERRNDGTTERRNDGTTAEQPLATESTETTALHGAVSAQLRGISPRASAFWISNTPQLSALGPRPSALSPQLSAFGPRPPPQNTQRPGRSRARAVVYVP